MGQRNDCNPQPSCKPKPQDCHDQQSYCGGDGGNSGGDVNVLSNDFNHSLNGNFSHNHILGIL